jgi:hypothetical protein
MPEDTAELGYTTGERVAAVLGLAVLAALALICLDLASGGRLAQFLEQAETGESVGNRDE